MPPATIVANLGAMGEHLTQEQHAQLAAELAELEGPRRAEIVEAIAVARGHGDLSENFEYHAAKNEQGLLERKITILRARLEDAEIVESGAGDVVGVGSKVVIEDSDGGQMEVEISGLGGAGKTSPSSPLGTALLGKKVGETVEVQAPKSTWQATVVSIASSS
jgi:transcription elongation factor GreA